MSFSAFFSFYEKYPVTLTTDDDGFSLKIDERRCVYVCLVKPTGNLQNLQNSEIVFIYFYSL